jgi:hypothetical protein
MLLDADDPHGNRSETYPPESILLLHKQKGGLIFPSPAVIKIITTAELIFKRKVIRNEKGITSEKHLDVKMQQAVLAQLGINLFKDDGEHYADHRSGESDHLTSLLRLIVTKYLAIRLKSYGKNYSEMVVHSNRASTRHLLTKKVIFSGL